MDSWCVHMDKDGFDKRLFDELSAVAVYCFICGAKRPQKPKSLAQKMNEEQWSDQVDFNKAAKTAIQHFEGLIDNLEITGLGKGLVNVEKLKAHLKEDA